MSAKLILRCPCCGQNSVTATLADDPENATHATVAADYTCDCMESGLVDERRYLARLDRAALRQWQEWTETGVGWQDGEFRPGDHEELLPPRKDA